MDKDVIVKRLTFPMPVPLPDEEIAALLRSGFLSPGEIVLEEEWSCKRTGFLFLPNADGKTFQYVLAPPNEPFCTEVGTEYTVRRSSGITTQFMIQQATNTVQGRLPTYLVERL